MAPGVRRSKSQIVGFSPAFVRTLLTLSHRGRDNAGAAAAANIQRLRIARAVMQRAYPPPCGGESNFDGLDERSEGQTSEIAREGFARAPRGMCHSGMDPRVALRFASLALG